jgi:hypothetical protein
VISDILNWAMLVLVALTFAGFVWVVRRPNREREAEDAARAFFDRHGRWPDEPAS